MMSRNFLLIGALTCAMAAWTQDASAQSTHTGKFIILKNIQPISGQAQKLGSAAIPLDASFDAEVNAEGDIVVRCKTGTDGAPSGACSNIGSGSGGGSISHVPSITFSQPSGVVAANDTSARLQWATTNAASCFGVSSTPAVSGWSASQPTAGTASTGFPVGNLPRNTTGNKTYQFVLGCYSTTPSTVGGQQVLAYTEASRTVSLAPSSSTPPEGQDFCDSAYPLGDPVRNIAGFTTPLSRVNGTFQQHFGVDFAHMVRNGANGEAIITTAMVGKGQYLAIPLDMPADMPDLHASVFDWTYPQDGYSQVAGFEMTFSPCPGDFRKNTSTRPTDPWARFQCRNSQPSNEGTRTVSSGVGQIPDTTGHCTAPKSKRIYMNITFHDLNAFRNSGADPSNSYLCEGWTGGCGTKIQASRAILGP